MSKNSRFFRMLALLVPEVTVRVQLFLATMMWLIGASILLVRGFGYISDRHWHAWALGIGLALGAIKSRTVLDHSAKRAVARIYSRGTAGFFGFLSGKSWVFIGIMMGGGMILRRIIVHPGVIGAGIMGAVYIGVGSALLLADRIFLHALYINMRSGSR